MCLAQEVIPIEFIPDAIKVMKGINIDISKQTSNHIDDPSLYPSQSIFYMENFRKIRKELGDYVDIFLKSFGRT